MHTTRRRFPLLISRRLRTTYHKPPPAWQRLTSARAIEVRCAARRRRPLVLKARSNRAAQTAGAELAVFCTPHPQFAALRLLRRQGVIYTVYVRTSCESTLSQTRHPADGGRNTSRISNVRCSVHPAVCTPLCAGGRVAVLLVERVDVIDRLLCVFCVWGCICICVRLCLCV